MRLHERNGFSVDECTGCRGIFLDRGELDRLIDAEHAWHGADRATRSAPAAEGRYRSDHDRYEENYGALRPRGQPRGASSAGGAGPVGSEAARQVPDRSSRTGRRRSFLGDLFD